jgi:hypothetical protein
MNKSKMLSRLAMTLLLSSGVIGAVQASKADHHEFEATLYAPFTADGADQDRPEARTFKLVFDFPLLEREQDVSWHLELVSPDGVVVQRWQGVQGISGKPVDVSIAWDGRAEGLILTEGVYQARMRAVTGDEAIEQSWDISVGQAPTQAMPAFKALPTAAARARAARTDGRVVQGAVAATASLPYTVYFGNLHSQTNHSDGGGAWPAAPAPRIRRAHRLGPADAYAYAKNKGLDFLMASEHNHMYDGSDGTNTGADAVKARALYQSGLKAAVDFNAANPNFLGVYGLEWGVINNGGHMNIFNTPELLEWEYNSSGQLIGDTFTAKATTPACTR